MGRNMMISRQQAALVSVPAAVCMLFVAWSEFSQGKPLGEVHLITPAPIAVAASTGSIGSTVTLNGGITYLGGTTINTIIDADYCPPANSRPLHQDGLTYPSESAERSHLIGNREAAKMLGVEPVIFVSV
jgi:hypothetical protein